MFSTVFGAFSLVRIPSPAKQPLVAWNAADELLLADVAQRFGTDLNGRRLLVLNDDFGALAIPLLAAGATVVSGSDSYVSQLAVQKNLAHNGWPEPQDNPQLQWMPCIGNQQIGNQQISDQQADAQADAQADDRIELQQPAWLSYDKPFDLVVMKVPKSLAYWQYLLQRLPPAPVVAGGMLKHMPKAVFQNFEMILGSLRTSLAKKKARLLYADEVGAASSLSSELPSGSLSDLPDAWQSLQIPEWALVLSALPNVFAHNKVDIGARFFLQQFAQLPAATHIVDLGCGNGLLGIQAQRLQPKAKLTFVDESYMAVASAKYNYQTVFAHEPNRSRADFIVSHALQNVSEPADLILCNPPFHQQYALGEHIANAMFQDAYNQLSDKGECWVVANRHLPYQPLLKKRFTRCERLAEDTKFIVYRCVR